jgi:hypothetical protein
LSGLPAFGDYADGSESNKLHSSNDGPIDHQPINFEHKEDKLYSKNLLHAGDSDMEIVDFISLPTSIGFVVELRTMEFVLLITDLVSRFLNLVTLWREKSSLTMRTWVTMMVTFVVKNAISFRETL